MVGRVRPNHLVIKTRAVPGAELIESVRLRSVVTKVGTRDSVAAQDIVQDKARARQFYFVGKKVNGSALAPGVYTGKATVVRDASEALRGEIVKSVTLE